MNPLECSPGHSGPNCSIQCPYPTYGEKCHGYCECDKDICDFATGCTRLTTGIYLDIQVFDILKMKERMNKFTYPTLQH